MQQAHHELDREGGAGDTAPGSATPLARDADRPCRRSATPGSSLPPARIFRRGAVEWPTWRNLGVRKRLDDSYQRFVVHLRPALRTFAIYAVGCFPLWAPIVLAMAFLWIAGLSGSP